MKELTYITLREQPALMNTAAAWFNSKWGVPPRKHDILHLGGMAF